MNQFYNTWGPADFWLNVEDFQEFYLSVCYPLEYWIFLLFYGAKIW